MLRMVAARAEGQRPLNVALRETTLSLLTFEGQPRAFSRKFIFFTLLQPSEAENQPKKKRRDYVVTDVCPATTQSLSKTPASSLVRPPYTEGPSDSYLLFAATSRPGTSTSISLSVFFLFFLPPAIEMLAARSCFDKKVTVPRPRKERQWNEIKNALFFFNFFLGTVLQPTIYWGKRIDASSSTVT